MEFITDLHLHSKYSRAVSKDMVLPLMAMWAKRKGINILSTGDWTHPLWFREIKDQLAESQPGLFKLKIPDDKRKGLLFLLSVEISSIYSQGGRGHRIHNLVFSPSFETAEKIIKQAMEGVLQRSYLHYQTNIPLLAHSAFGDNFGEVK